MTVICLHIMVSVLKDSWRLEADLMHVGTAMSVEFDTTHRSCCCCEPLNLEQHISLTPSPHAVGPLPFSTCNIESGQRKLLAVMNILLSSPAYAANAMQRAEDFVL